MDQLLAIINNKAYESDANRSCHNFLSGYSYNPLSAVANQIALALRNEVAEATTVLISKVLILIPVEGLWINPDGGLKNGIGLKQKQRLKIWSVKQKNYAKNLFKQQYK